MKIGLIGYGIVGKAIDFTVSEYFETVKYDKYQEQYNDFNVLKDCEFIFIAVPTPFDCKENKSNDSAVVEALQKLQEINFNNIVIVKSTIAPGRCAFYKKEFNLNIVFNPEFLRESTTPNEDFKNQHIIVIGNDNEEQYLKTESFFKKFCREDAKYFNTSTTEAEMIKCCQNTMLASRVAVANMIYDACQKMGVNYENIREVAFKPFDIIGPHMTMVPGPDGKRGYGGKCLPKDIRALGSVCDSKLIRELISYNDGLRDDLGKFMDNWENGN